MLNNASQRRRRFRSLGNEIKDQATDLANAVNNTQVATFAISNDTRPIIKEFGHPSVPQVLNRYGYVPKDNNPEPMHMIEDALEKLNPAATSDVTLVNIENSTTLFINSIAEENQRRNNNNNN